MSKIEVKNFKIVIKWHYEYIIIIVLLKLNDKMKLIMILKQKINKSKYNYINKLR